MAEGSALKPERGAGPVGEYRNDPSAFCFVPLGFDGAAMLGSEGLAESGEALIRPSILPESKGHR